MLCYLYEKRQQSSQIYLFHPFAKMRPKLGTNMSVTDHVCKQIKADFLNIKNVF